jgi:nucleoside-diphosphate-sugar epimerase
MRYLVLGSAGKIGRHLVKYLQTQGHDVFTWDLASSVWEDLRVENRINDALDEVDFVFFLAYDVGGSSYLKKYQDTFEFIDNNVLIMMHTFNSLKRYNKPFIFVSSEMANLGFSTYGILKSVGDCYVRSLGSIVTKLWNTYSTDQANSSKAHAINDFINMAKKDKKITLKTNGKEERQLLYVDDCCECLYTLSKNYNVIDRNKEIHIASFKWTSILETAETVARLCGNVPVITSEHSDMTHKNVKIEPNPYVLEFWKPKTSLENGILNIINYETTNMG